MIGLILAIILALALAVVIGMLMINGMVKRTTINVPELVSIMRAMEASGFRVGELIQFIIDEATGRASHDLPNAVVTNFERVVSNYIDNPIDTAMDTGVSYGFTRVSFKALGWALKAVKIKTTIRVGKISIKIAG